MHYNRISDTSGAVLRTSAVARFTTGRRLAAGQWPGLMPNWRVTTSDADTAEAVAMVLGGTVETYFDAGFKTRVFDVYTAARTVHIRLSGPAAVVVEFFQWSRGSLAHHCDGMRFLSPVVRRGLPCGCPGSWAERAARHRQQQLPQPCTTVGFHLGGACGLGPFVFTASGSRFARAVQRTMDMLPATDVPARCALTLLIPIVKTAAGGLRIQVPALAPTTVETAALTW